VIQKITEGFGQFWKDKDLSPWQKHERLAETCRRVFGTPEGKIVLNMLLTDLYFFDRTHDTDEDALNNYAKFLIRERLGVGDTVTLSNFIAETAASRGGKHDG
jgi:hypothetical protein